MTCDDAARLILAGAERALDPAGRHALDEHTASCEACRQQARDQAAVAALLRSLSEQPVSPDFTQRVLQQLGPGVRWLDQVDWRKWTWRLSPAAAAVLLAALLLSPGRAAPASSATAQRAGEPSIGIMESWVTAGNGDGLPAAALLWQPNVSDESLLVTVLTANPDAKLGGTTGGR